MQQPVKPAVSYDGPPLSGMPSKTPRKGMTPDELDTLIIEMTQKCPMMIFEYHQLDRDRGIAIAVKYGLAGHHWGTVYSADMWRKACTPEFLYELEYTASFYEKYGKRAAAAMLSDLPWRQECQMTPRQAREYIESRPMKKMPPSPLIQIKAKMGMTINKRKSFINDLAQKCPGIILEDETCPDQSVGLYIQCGKEDWVMVLKPSDLCQSDLAKAIQYAESRCSR